MPMTKDEMLALIVKGTPDFEPDTKHPYSNSGYFLLGLILEKVTGKPYEPVPSRKESPQRSGSKTHTRDRTHRCEQKRSSDLYSISAATGNRYPKPIRASSSAQARLFQPLATWPNSSRRCSTGRLISKESLDRMKTMRDGEGFGMVTFTFAGKTFYGHTGGADNYGAWLAYQPEEKLAVAYTTNAKVYPVEDIVQRRGRHLLRQAVSDSRLGIDRRQPGSSGQIRRRLFRPGRARESYDHQGRLDAFLSTAGELNRRPARSDGAG